MAKSSKRKWSAIEGRYINPPRENLPETTFSRDKPTGTLSVSGKKLAPEEEHEFMVREKADIAAIKSKRTASSNMPELESPAIQMLQKMRAMNEKEELKRQISEKLESGAEISQLTEELLEQQLERKQKEENGELDLDTEQLESGILPEEKKTEFTRGEAWKALKKEPIKELGREAENVLKQTLTPIAKVWDWTQSILSSGKGIEQKTAEMAWNKVVTQLNSDLQSVKIGFKDARDVKAKLQLAERINNKIESSSKAFGIFNLRYLVSEGIDIETQVTMNREFLADYKKELDIAQIQAMKLEYGL